jgi:hypothetical protein
LAHGWCFFSRCFLDFLHVFAGVTITAESTAFRTCEYIFYGAHPADKDRFCVDESGDFHKFILVRAD